MLQFFCYNFTDEKSTSEIISDINKMIEETKRYEREEDIMLFVFVPTVSLEKIIESFDHKYVKISAQSFSLNENPAIIGELTSKKLKDIKADMVIAGLADSRFYKNETNEICRDKIEKVLNEGFKSMLCVGETEEMVKENTASKVLEEQVRIGCSKIPYEAHYRIGIIYKPLWAFGTDAKESEDKYVLDQLAVIKKAAKETLPGFPIEMPIFYGGIMPVEKMVQYITNEIIDGVFVDSMHMGVDEFIDMIHKCQEIDFEQVSAGSGLLMDNFMKVIMGKK